MKNAPIVVNPKSSFNTPPNMDKAKCFYSVTLFVNGENKGGFTLSEYEADTIYDALTEYKDPEQDRDDNPSSTVMAKLNVLWERT